MRIIKLSKKEFDLEEVLPFFERDLPSRKPPGQFRIPSGWIDKKHLSIGEPLLFSYEGHVLYSARAGSGRLDNNDECCDDYPFYFQVDVDSIRRVNTTLNDVESQLRQAGIEKSIVRCQGWPTLPDSAFTNALWLSLRGD